MNEQPANPIRVLALDPVTRGLGYAVLEGSKDLIDWGVKTPSRNHNSEHLDMVARMIGWYQPDVLVLEDCTDISSRRRLRVQELIQKIISLASKVGVKTNCFSPREIRSYFSETETLTKYEIASAIAGIFPELASRLPRVRRLWMSEDYRMHIFDAVSLALAFYHFGEG